MFIRIRKVWPYRRMLRLIKEGEMNKMMKKMTEKKGFTLAELLIVVAIIAVLVAISIPIFTSQLEKAREATDAANIRSAYAEVMVEALTQDTPAAVTRTVTLKQQQNDWQGDTNNSTLAGSGLIAGTGHVDPTVSGTPSANGTCTVTWTPPTGTATDGTVTIAFP